MSSVSPARSPRLSHPGVYYLAAAPKREHGRIVALSEVQRLERLPQHRRLRGDDDLDELLFGLGLYFGFLGLESLLRHLRVRGEIEALGFDERQQTPLVGSKDEDITGPDLLSRERFGEHLLVAHQLDDVGVDLELSKTLVDRLPDEV